MRLSSSKLGCHRAGGIGNKVQVGDMGWTTNLSGLRDPTVKSGSLDFMDVWYPIQVKQKTRREA